MVKKRKSIEQLKREISRLQKKSKKEQERKLLKRKLFQLKHRRAISAVKRASGAIDGIKRTSRGSRKRTSKIRKFGNFSQNIAGNIDDALGTL